MEKQNIQRRSLEFWIKVAKYYLQIKEKKYYEIASQLFRSWTSIWANVAEAQSWCSKKDFINKMNIALKEWEETLYWFEILEKWFNEDITELRNDCEELVKILVTIIKNTKHNMENNKE